MQNQSENLEKLRQYFEIKGIAQKDIAEALGTSNQYVNGFLSGRNVIGKRLAENLENHFGLSSAWLLTGKGSMLVGQDNQEKRPQENLPLIPTNAVGGFLSGTDGQWMDYDCEHYIIPAFKKSDFLIRVEGDSMEPKYCRGDIVACKRVPLNDLWFQWGKVYVIDTKQGTLIKYIQPGLDEEHITLVSENGHYKPFQLPKYELNGIAIVNGLIRVE